MLDAMNDRKSFTVPDPDILVPLDLFERARLDEVSNRSDTPRVLDLFAGAGGLSLGFKAAGYTITGANEIDLWASGTIKANFPDQNVLCADIRKLDDSCLKEAFGNVDVIIGGPPCQGFSIANNSARNIDDPRNSLFKEFMRAISLFLPSAVVFENVAGLVKKKTSNGDKYIDIILQEIEALGYIPHARILEAQDYGVPQIRPRLIIVATRTPINNPYPSITHAAPLPPHFT